MAELRSRTVHCGGGASKGLEIGGDCDCFGAGSFGLLPDLLDQRRTIDQREPAAFARDPERHGSADALRCTGDDGDLAGKAPSKDHRCLMPLGQMW
jgi:hypothetical protein